MQRQRLSDNMDLESLSSLCSYSNVQNNWEDEDKKSKHLLKRK